MSNHLVPVYILASDPESKKVRKLTSLFSHPMFKLYVINIDDPKDFKERDGISIKDQIKAHRHKWCLNNAREKHRESHAIIVKDTSVSNASVNQIANVISAAIANGKWDLCYLNKWLDRCDLHSDRKPVNGTMSTITKTVEPHGLQAVVYSPNGRDIILGDKEMKNGKLFQDKDKPLDKPLDEKILDNIKNKNIEATTTEPNLINYDVGSAKKPTDYLKANGCNHRSITGKNMQEENQTNTWLWVILIIVIFLILGYFLYKRNEQKY